MLKNRDPAEAALQAMALEASTAVSLFLTPSQVRRYLTCMKTAVSSKGQIVLPAEVRRMDRVEPGQVFDVERLERGDYRLAARMSAEGLLRAHRL